MRRRPPPAGASPPVVALIEDKPKTIHQKVTFRASPDALFDTYLSSRRHSAPTGAPARW